MPEPCGYDMYRYPGQQQSRGVQVPQVMQTGMREQGRTGPLVMGSDDLAHQSGDRIGVQRLTPASGEDMAIYGSPPRIAKEFSLRSLEPLRSLKYGGGVIVNADRPGAAALGRPVDPLAIDDRS